MLRKIKFNKETILNYMKKTKINTEQFCAICKINKKYFNKIMNEEFIEAGEKATRIAILIDKPLN